MHFFFLRKMIFLIFGCAGSLLLHGLFSSCRKQRLFSICVRASHCGGFPYCRACALGCVGFSSCGARAYLLCHMWDLPGSGIVSCPGRLILFPRAPPIDVAAAAESRQSRPALCSPVEGTHQAPPCLGLSRQEHWSGLPFPSPMHESEK